MPYDVNLEEHDPQPLAAIRYRVPAGELPRIMGEAFGRLFGHVGRLGGRPTGDVLSVYHAFDEQGVDVEAAIGVAAPVAEEPGDGPEGRIIASSLPGGLCAHTTHYGPYDELGTAYEAVTAWMQEHGYEPAGPMWEIYRNDPHAVADPSEIVTDVYVPVK